MRLGIFSNKASDQHAGIIYDLLDHCYERGYQCLVHDSLRKVLSEKLPDTEFYDDDHFPPENVDFVISLGGDGTMLNAVSLIGDKEIPIVGINLGRLGFLASIEKKYVKDTLSALENGRYRIDERTMLFLDSNKPMFRGRTFALNDFTLHKRDTSSMITIKAYINGEFLNTYWADGLIVSTPTGSTGYSLSCGGPIIFPQSNNFVVTPVAPHNLNVRPIVISDNSVITFEIRGRTNNFLCSLDSRVETIDDTFELAVRKCPFSCKLIAMYDYSYMQNIRQKLTWGIDKRNY